MTNTDHPPFFVQPPEEKPWGHVRKLYRAAENDEGLTEEEYARPPPPDSVDVRKAHARHSASEALAMENYCTYVVESETLWVYDEERGEYDRYGESWARAELNAHLKWYYTPHEGDIIVEKLKLNYRRHRRDLEDEHPAQVFTET